MRTALHLCLRAGRTTACSAVFLAAMAASPAADCNGNGVEDSVDLSAGDIALPAAPLFLHVTGLTSALVAGDLDGDSDPDLIAGNVGGDVFVFRNEGVDGLVPARRWLGASGPPVVSLATVDLEGDGDVDVAAAAASGTDGKLAVLRNRGDASFDHPRRILLPEPPARCVSTGDIDLDGDADLAAAVPFAVHIFPNIGRGELGDVVRLSVGSNPHAVATADLDADGLPDLVTANSLGGPRQGDNVSVLLNGGARGFGLPRNFAAGRGTPSLAVKDMDGDGDLDVAVANAASRTITVLSNDGKGDLSPRELFTTARSLIGGTPVLVLEDLDRDGAIDIALAGASVFVLVFQRMGSFAPSVYLLPLRSATPGLVAPDLDGDGDRDLAFTDDRGLGVIHHTGAVELEEPRLYSHRGSIHSIASGDLDSDGDADLVAADEGQHHVSVLLNGGRGAFADPMFHETPSPGWVALGDLDLDGDADAATANWSVDEHPQPFSASLLFNAGNGTFLELVRIGLMAPPQTVMVAGIDADDLPDLLFTSLTEGVDVLLARNGTFLRKEARVLGEYPRLVADDFDGDGDVDLAAASRWNGPARVSLVLNEGDGTFGEPRELIPQADSSRSIAATDLDADGLVDLVVLGGSPAVLVSSGGGRFEVREAPELPTRPQFAVRAADIDGDLDQDLVSTAYIQPHALTVLRNQGDGTFLPPVEVSGLGRLRDLVAVDVSGDGLADIAGCETDVVVLLNETLAPRSRDADRNGVPDECEEVSFRRGDADGSGGLDITDALFLLGHLFAGLAGPPCEKGADADDDGALLVTDAIHILGFLFRRGDSPPAPFPGCGLDPTADTLGCRVYEGCP